MATTLAAAVLLPVPAALAAQTPSEARRQLIVSERIHRTWTIDSVLVALAADSAPWEGVSRPRFETRQAADAAQAIVSGFGGRVWKQVEGIASPLSQAERDAFAERLVAIAIANPESEGVDLSRGSDGRKPTREEYAALDDATNELYEAGVIDTPCPYPGMGGMGHYSKHDPPTRARGR